MIGLCGEVTGVWITGLCGEVTGWWMTGLCGEVAGGGDDWVVW